VGTISTIPESVDREESTTLMYCLHCGDCCRRMSPISAPDPCPHLVEIGTFVFCGIYENRPKECRDHDYPARVCPIGASMLNLPTPDDLRQRIDEGYAMTSGLCALSGGKN